MCIKNDELVSSSDDGEIKVWRINKDDYHLINILKGHSVTVNKVIELKDDKFSS